MKRAAREGDAQLSLAFDSPIAPRTSGGASTRHARVGGEVVAYQLRRARRRTIGFTIDDRGLVISAPRWVPLREIEAAIVEKRRWITSRQRAWDEWREKQRLPQVSFVDGGTLPFLGAPVTMRLRADLSETRFDPSAAEVQLALPPDAGESQVRDAVQAWLQREARRILGERIEHFAERRDPLYSGWTLSSARSQWGSCTHDGRIRLSWRLVHFSLPIIDYVVAHELAHLKELNHSPRFWKAVGQLLPGFEAARDEIRRVDAGAMPL